MKTSGYLSSQLPSLIQQRSVARAPDKVPQRQHLQAGQQTKAAFGEKVDLSKDSSKKFLQDALLSEIGKQVDTVLQNNGLDIRDAAGLDWSAEATSQRIFEGTTGLFGVWRGQHPEMSEKELIDSFEKTIRKAVDQGAGEAMSILVNAGFGNETKDTASETMAMVHDKFDAFFDELRQGLENQ